MMILSCNIRNEGSNKEYSHAVGSQQNTSGCFGLRTGPESLVEASLNRKNGA